MSSLELKKNEKKRPNWKKLFFEMSDIAQQAIYLADCYAGGESENAIALQERFDKCEIELDSLE